MSQTSTGTHNEPLFASSGNTPTFAADLSLVSDYAAEYGNTKVGTTTQRNAFTPWEGLVWYDTTLDFVMVYNGSTWVTIKAMGQTGHPFAEAAGLVTSGASTGTNVVTFPASRFSVAPIISITASSSAPIDVVIALSALSASAMTVTISNPGGFVSNVGFHWRAVQMTSSTAAG